MNSDYPNINAIVTLLRKFNTPLLIEDITLFDCYINVHYSASSNIRLGLITDTTENISDDIKSLFVKENIKEKDLTLLNNNIENLLLNFSDEERLFLECYYLAIKPNGSVFYREKFIDNLNVFETFFSESEVDEDVWEYFN